jgi:hypothetical protein
MCHHLTVLCEKLEVSHDWVSLSSFYMAFVILAPEFVQSGGMVSFNILQYSCLGASFSSKAMKFRSRELRQALCGGVSPPRPNWEDPTIAALLDIACGVSGSLTLRF